MTIIARLGSTEVEVLEAHSDQAGRKFARVHALQGEPFTRWTSGGWAPSSTETVRAELLQDVHTTLTGVQGQTEPAKPTRLSLLDMAKAASKDQWFTGEVSWLVGGPHAGGAYLKNIGGFVRMYLAAGGPGLNIYMLGREGWRPVKDLDRKYQDWKLIVSGEQQP